MLEKPNAIEACQKQIGHVSIKIGTDFIKNKKQKKGFTQYGNNNYNDDTMATEYGAFIFSITGVERNQEQIVKEFKSLPFL